MTEVTNAKKEARFLKAAEKAKNLYSANKRSQLEITTIAMSVCEITRGGVSASGLFTIKRFAEASGIDPKTLSNWIATKRMVFDKLSETQKRTAKWGDLVWCARTVSPKSSNTVVQKTYQDFIDKDSYSRTLIRYMCELKTLANAFKTKNLAFKASKDQLREIKFYCSAILSSIDEDSPGLIAQENGIAHKRDYAPGASIAYGLGPQKKKRQKERRRSTWKRGEKLEPRN